MAAQFSLRRGAGIITMRNAPVNGLSLKLRDGILRSLDDALKSKCPAVVLTGDGKMFSAGADIAEFAKGTYDNPPNLRYVIQQLDNFPIPLVAYINGAALGGGLETALACHWRVGSTTSRLALPEVHLGILPGAGGTQRLPRLLGVRPAVEIMTSGRMLGANEALKLGILDKIIHTSGAPSGEEAIESAVDFALSQEVLSTPISDRKLSTRPVPGGLTDAEFETIYESVRQNAKGFVAPESIAHAARGAAIATSFDAGLALEGALFQALFKGSQAKALQYLFFAERRAQKVTDIPDTIVPRPVKSVGIIGYDDDSAALVAGIVDAGMQVRWAVNNEAEIAQAKSALQKIYRSSAAFNAQHLSEDDILQKIQKIQITSDVRTLSGADCRINCNASGSSNENAGSIIGSTARALKDFDFAAPKDIDISFPHPIKKQRLMEIVRGSSASVEDVVTLMKFGEKLGKIPIVTKSPVGRKMFSCTIMEAFKLIDEGATPSQIDKALKNRVGYRKGPFEVMDMMGSAAVEKCLDLRYLGTDGTSSVAPGALTMMRERGWTGRGAKQGWYKYSPEDERTPEVSEDVNKLIDEYRANKGLSVRSDITDEEIVERCMYPAINEAISALESGSAMRPDDIDVLYVNGYGFPKYKGGPLWWAEREVKLVKVMSAFVKYEKLFPDAPWWKACGLLRSCVSSGAPIREEMYFMKENKMK